MVADLKNYNLFAVDFLGVASARYELMVATDKEAKRQAEAYLRDHAVLELWTEHRRVARLKRR